MTIVGAGVGDVAVVPPWLDGANLSRTNARIAVLPSRDVAMFVYYAMIGDVGQAAIDSVVKGSAQPGINLAHIDMFKVPRPPRLQQEAVVEFLDQETTRIDDLIARVSDATERLKELRTGLISAAVTGKIDVRAEVI